MGPESWERDDIYISLLTMEDIVFFKRDIQEAFQQGYEDEFGPCDEEILPEKDIDSSLDSPGAVAFKAVMNGQLVGGAIVVIDKITQHNHLDLLYVKTGYQGKGIGFKIWKTIEKSFPDTQIWETHTPYFEKRNIYFYVNKCNFKIVEFYTPWHRDPNQMTETVGGMDRDVGAYFFRFEKIISPAID